MNRRESLKALGLTALSTTVLVGACKNGTDGKLTVKTEDIAGREIWEVERENKLKAENFFTEHEIATITILVDIIIPKDSISGSATDAEVPAFIEFIVKDMPEHQLPMRGGLKWLEMQSLKRFTLH